MSINQLIEQNRLKNHLNDDYTKLKDIYPSCNASYAIEVDIMHMKRLLSLTYHNSKYNKSIITFGIINEIQNQNLNDYLMMDNSNPTRIITTNSNDIIIIDGGAIEHSQIKSTGCGIILSNISLVLNNILPIECFKYITRSFHIPYCCRDLNWIKYHPFIKELLANNSSIIFKIQTYPKILSNNILQILNEITINKNKFKFHSTEYSHIFQLVYSPKEALYRFGVSNVDQCNRNLLTTESLSSSVNILHASRGLPPVCRAYYKMQEISDFYWNSYNWLNSDDFLNNNNNIIKCCPFTAVDVGASPGGWTQFLISSHFCNKVIAVDAGEIHPSILSIPGVDHIPTLIQTSDARNALMNVQSSLRLLVCDINVDPYETSKILTNYVIPYLVKFNCNDNNDKVNGSFIVMTLKLFKNPKQHSIEQAAAFATQNLSNGGCFDFRIVHLTANSSNERTLLCRY
jgi:23S rRNA U2552 (ribose-2'-O)-methylase RlmE/FtsJ